MWPPSEFTLARLIGAPLEKYLLKSKNANNFHKIVFRLVVLSLFDLEIMSSYHKFLLLVGLPKIYLNIKTWKSGLCSVNNRTDKYNKTVSISKNNVIFIRVQQKSFCFIY